MYPSVSIVVPCYNSEQYLESTFESILRQTYENIEIIAVNDGSTDATAGIISKYARKDKRIKVVNHRANSGLSAARNSGVRAASSEFICFLDSDDLLMADSIEDRVTHLHRSAEDVAGVYAGSVTIGESVLEAPSSSEFSGSVVDFLSSSGQCPFNANQPMLKRTIFNKIGGFDESLKQAEDFDLWLRILRAGYMFLPTKRKTITYRARANSMIRNGPEKHLDVSLQLIKSSYEDWTSVPRTYPRSSAWQKLHYQIKSVNRILEFNGMLAATEAEVSEVVDNLRRQLPDITTFISKHRDIGKGLWRGVERYYAGSLVRESQNWRALSEKIAAIETAVRMPCAESFGSLEAPGKKCKVNEDVFERLIGRLTWDYNRQRQVRVAFFPHKDYHVWTYALIKEELERRNISSILVDFSAYYRDERVRSKAKELGLELVSFSNFVLSEIRPEIAVCFNDWDPILRSVLLAANEANISTVGIVEGIQDYWDEDVGRERHAYRTVSNVILPGKFDAKYFKDSEQTIFIGGIPRIEALANEGSGKKAGDVRKKCLINSNFSYGVLVEHRDDWLESAVDAVKRAGFEPIVSRHPADLGKSCSEFVSDKSFYELLDEVDVTVQKFASGILEALAKNVPVIYYNPHSEKVDKFKDPKEAYLYCEDQERLTEILRKREYFCSQEKSREFLSEHCNLGAADSAINIADALENILQNRNKPVDGDRFDSCIRQIDLETNCFSRLPNLEKYRATYARRSPAAGRSDSPFTSVKETNWNGDRQANTKQPEGAGELLGNIPNTDVKPAGNSGKEVPGSVNDSMDAKKKDDTQAMSGTKVGTFERRFPTFSLIVDTVYFGCLWLSKRILGWGGVWLLTLAGLVAGYFMYPELRSPWLAVAVSVFAGWSVLFLTVAHGQYLGNRNRRERRVAINDLRGTVKKQQRDIDRLSRALEAAKTEIAHLAKGDDARKVAADLGRQIELSRSDAEEFARKRIDAAVDELKRRIADIEGRHLEGDMEKIAAELRERIEGAEERFAETAEDLRERMSASSAQGIESVRMLNDAFERLDAVVKREVEYLNRAIQLGSGNGGGEKSADPALGPDGWVKRAIDKADADLNKVTKRFDAQIAAVAKDIKSNADVQNKRFSLLSGANSAGANGHLRYLNDTDIKRILEFWIPTFGLPRNRKALSYIANKICNVEQICDGRLATTIQAAMLRTLALRSLGKETIEVLEIGTLFGIGAAALYKTADFGTRVSLTLIDPLDGYYNAGADSATGMPVNRDVLEGNLSALSIPESDYRIIQHYSDSEEALGMAGDRLYDFVLIDGDHSLAGVTRDFELYGDMVRPGGLLVFDDYDTTDWPAIKPFVDDVVRADGRWQWIGGEWRTGILRRVSSSQDLAAESRIADGSPAERAGNSGEAK
ncbi:glycosyltransferase [Stappia sp. GBMRC 2046]|uniref:Glycosyltransferase n=1 Tax=Stappia sediminis TaxID=2692190 RepID=A0A7X3LY67_9HYPH|nr:glycosyltransferase [Stappia sediminis]MXN67191.1 glycosyltransferase [Stappia sediminis]